MGVKWAEQEIKCTIVEDTINKSNRIIDRKEMENSEAQNIEEYNI